MNREVKLLVERRKISSMGGSDKRSEHSRASQSQERRPSHSQDRRPSQSQKSSQVVEVTVDTHQGTAEREMDQFLKVTSGAKE